jgi:hypothetical protein
MNSAFKQMNSTEDMARLTDHSPLHTVKKKRVERQVCVSVFEKLRFALLMPALLNPFVIHYCSEIWGDHTADRQISSCSRRTGNDTQTTNGKKKKKK